MKTAVCRRYLHLKSKYYVLFIILWSNSGTMLNIWNGKNDIVLKSLVLDSHQYDWKVLASHFNTTILDVKGRWQKNIYPTIRSTKQIAGAYIWTNEEDQIIRNAEEKSECRWQNLLEFLPARTHFSLEARWKRVHQDRSHNKKKYSNGTAANHVIWFNHQKRLQEFRIILQERKHKPKCETNSQEGYKLQHQKDEN